MAAVASRLLGGPGLVAGAAMTAALLAGGPAAAHGVGMSQLALRLNGSSVTGEWEIQLADARLALGLDPRLQAEAGWRDLGAHESRLRAYLAGQLALSADGAGCPIDLPTSAPLEWEDQQSQVRVHLTASCPFEPTRLRIHCGLLFDLDPKHRAYFSVQDERITHIGTFRQNLREITIEAHHFHAWTGFLEFAREGVIHIWSGLDHILFLIALLLPAPLLRAGDGWSPRARFGTVLREVVKVVTAFTVAHSLTLGLSFFGVVILPPRVVEGGIALSVFAAAWNNLRPFLPGRSWLMALGFGLVHGLAFAGALRNLALPTQARGLALAAFNVGVEVGQLAIVALVMPLLYGASKRRFYPRLVLGGGSFAIAWLAVLWVLDRGFGLSFLTRV